MNFLVFRDEQRQGPYSQEQVKLGLEEGWLAATDLIWYEGLPDWKRIEEVFEIQRLPKDAPVTYAKPAAPVAPFAAEPESSLPARTQIMKKQPLPARPRPAGAQPPVSKPGPVELKPLPGKVKGNKEGGGEKSGWGRLLWWRHED